MDDEHKIARLEERISRLEARIRRLEGELDADDSVTINVDPAKRQSDSLQSRNLWRGSEEPEPSPSTYASNSASSYKHTLLQGENWLNRLGIALLLLGVAFLFKFSIDQGWLVPPVRSLIGLGIGLALFIPGLQMSRESGLIKQIFLGGGIAVFYITGFATFQLYDFVSSPVVWAFMIVVTLLAFSLSLRQDEAVLSVVGILGGLGTPFMLYTGSGSLWALIAYTSLLLSAGGLIYFIKGWLSLLWSTISGGWIVILVALFNNLIDAMQTPISERIALQSGVLVCLVCFWILPVIREVLLKRGSADWVEENPSPDEGASLQLIALIIPLLAFLISMTLWNLTEEVQGAYAMASALVVGYVYLPLRNEGLVRLGSLHGFTALILLTASFYLLFQGNLLYAILTLEALGLRIAAQSTGDRFISLSSHFIFGLVILWLGHEFFTYSTAESPILNLTALTQLGIIGITGLAAPYWMIREQEQNTYYLIGHLALLGWFYSELSGVGNGQAYISLCWGVYALALLVAGFIKEFEGMRVLGMGTIFLVVGKLFVIDLAQLQAIWRILLFIGFGAVFLLIGYYLQRRLGE